MKMDDTRFLEELNSISITLEDLRRATDEVHKLAPGDRNVEGRLFTMARVFKGQPKKGLAVEFRLVAMTRMLEAEVLPGWVLPKQPDGSVAVSEPVWLATASEPLVPGPDEPTFEQKSFLARVLSLAEAEGNA
jgi:hypothetical protein